MRIQIDITAEDHEAIADRLTAISHEVEKGFLQGPGWEAAEDEDNEI